MLTNLLIEVKIALDTKQGRLIHSFPSSTTLWEILKFWETNEQGKGIEITRRSAIDPGGALSEEVYMQPCLLYKPYQKEVCVREYEALIMLLLFLLL